VTSRVPATATNSRQNTYLGLDRSGWAIGLTAVVLNVLVNGVLPQRSHIPACLAASALVTGLALKAGVSLGEQGLRPGDYRRGAAYGLAVAAAIGAGVGAGVRFEKLRPFYQEQRVVGASTRRMAYEVLLRIPFGTALSEETIFRGAIPGVMSRHHHPLIAAGVSSLLFGLWHIPPALVSVRANTRLANGPWRDQVARIATSVGVTSVAGVLLSMLRYRSRSLLAPWVAHSAANSTGYLISWFTARNARPGTFE